MPKTYRNGAVGALMDEYERANEELYTVLGSIDTLTFLEEIDPETKDPDCRSIQTIMNHVVRSGYGYANSIRKQFGEARDKRKKDYGLASPAAARAAMEEMMAYTLATMTNRWNITYKEIIANDFTVSWGQTFDFEQIVEHAIVHVLRHRRQIERFLIKKGSCTLYRPVNQAELDLIAESDWKAFPPRLPDQPIFYPVLNEEYARQISERWNVPAYGIGYVVKFDIDWPYRKKFATQIAGGPLHEELWVPAEEMDEFNSHIVGKIEVVGKYRPQ